MLWVLASLVIAAAVAQTAQPWQPCIGLASTKCLPFDFAALDQAAFDRVGSGTWSATPDGTLKVTAPASAASGSACARTGGSALLIKAASALPLKRSIRARVRLVGAAKGAVGFMFRRVGTDERNYGTLTLFNDPDCLGNSGSVAGFARSDGNSHVKPAWVNNPGFAIAADTWYTFSMDLVNSGNGGNGLVRWRITSDKFTEGSVGAFFSDFIFGLLDTASEAVQGGGFGFFCSPGSTCEFDNAVAYDTTVHKNLTGHLYCASCQGLVWPVPSSDWCRCCQYSCGGAGEETRNACRTGGFCTAANRCQNTPDEDRGFPTKYCDAHQITPSDVPVPSVPQTPAPPTSAGAPTTAAAAPTEATTASASGVAASVIAMVAASLIHT